MAFAVLDAGATTNLLLAKAVKLSLGWLKKETEEGLVQMKKMQVTQEEATAAIDNPNEGAAGDTSDAGDKSEAGETPDPRGKKKSK